MPDNLSYLILGLVVTFVIVGGFTASMALRARSLRKDLDLIETLNQEE